MNRKARSRLAKETLAILDAGRYTLDAGQVVDMGDALRRCLADTRSFGPDDLHDMREQALSQATPSGKTLIEVVNQSTLCGAAQLSRCVPDRQIGVLNFASARNPGGGFLAGSQAQEGGIWQLRPRRVPLP
ncbi:TIGR02452 family protein [Halomonas sp. NO4]|uniref:TIGR02452 family protein n=1 Tax=Halomonas sp. NO4 TaxID=2484813 RepID=UPI0013D5FAEE|nr:TIGR02452 family protein [Halomonas sp. NO4]